jgi:uncharacterized membrane protein
MNNGQEAPSTENHNAAPGDPSAPDVVWSFRGYKLRASEFTTAMVHLFRAEISRANVWRQRLDTTTNWAVVTTGAAISFTFSQSSTMHYVIVLNILLVTMFLWIEARRYRYYELWSYRVRLMETDFFASMLVPPFHPSADWAEALSEHLLHPHFPISLLEAIGRRLRRNYLWIYTVIGAAWVGKLLLQPTPVTTLDEFLQRASVGQIPGYWVLVIAAAFATCLVLISLVTVGMQSGAGEVLPRYRVQHGQDLATALSKNNRLAWFRPVHKRPQLLTFIITDQAQNVSDRIMKDMSRGVTGVSGVGMFTQHAHTVLMCALTITEVPQLKALVADTDPSAFVIVTPAQEVFGKGFIPLAQND